MQNTICRSLLWANLYWLANRLLISELNPTTPDLVITVLTSPTLAPVVSQRKQTFPEIQEIGHLALCPENLLPCQFSISDVLHLNLSRTCLTFKLAFPFQFASNAI